MKKLTLIAAALFAFNWCWENKTEGDTVNYNYWEIKKVALMILEANTPEEKNKIKMDPNISMLCLNLSDIITSSRNPYKETIKELIIHDDDKNITWKCSEMFPLYYEKKI